MATPLLPYFELTGPVAHIAPPEQVNVKLWKRVVILDVVDEQQAGEGEIKIEFLQHLMELLDGVRAGQWVTIRFTVRGVAYIRAGNPGHLVVLRGHSLRVLAESELPHPELRRALADRHTIEEHEVAPSPPNTIRLGSRAKPTPFPKGPTMARDEEPPF